MKATRLFVLTCALAMLGAVPAFAQSVIGEFRVVNDDGTRYMAFNADIYSSGRASGDVKFSGPLPAIQDVDGEGIRETKEQTISMGVSVDCGRLDGNRAVISGLVKDSNVSTYVGRRVLLTVEDGIEGKTRDAYTWGLYTPAEVTWVATDADLKEDRGAGTTWVATDFEREDDKGISASTMPEEVDCQTFTLASYELEELSESGAITIR